jgi:hypothetical protein
MAGIDLSKDFLKYTNDLLAQNYYKDDQKETRRTYNGEINNCSHIISNKNLT